MTHTDHRRLALLGLLHYHDANGYQLHAHASGMGIIGIKRPAAYNLLDTMVGRGWLRELPANDGGRTQRRFELTEAGNEATLALLRAQLARADAPDFPSLVSLAWLERLPPEEARALLMCRAASLEEELAPADGDDASQHAGIIDKVLRHIRRARALELDLVNELIQDLDAGGEL